ncbi:MULTISPECIES: methylmalonyl-CoA mutase small subunit [Aestuariimicrobium]|uniref:methylmalonyl-CoA mutase small subunit n=1 Tax=Aestuariimicrobium TaxID=396388 RepID=UPI0003B4A6F8|nr:MULTISPECIES: methylmalonyl-CoA mutase small subunit [Aestuariimicrobium]CAI9404170.1 Methylmalonyl-CoA mutase small subunit [Aestuariimicrobium sp. T2.26MG-19.2B]
MTTPITDTGVEAGDTGFARVFETPTEQQWQDAVLKVLNKGRPEGKELDWEAGHKRLVSHTVDGLDIEPLFTRSDDDPPLGHPGAAPFTRGTTVRSGDMDAWDVRALHEDPDVDTTRKAILEDLERGATSLWLRVDPDAIAAGDLETVLADVLLDLAKIDVSSHTDQRAAADALLAVYEGTHHDHSSLSLNLGLDPIGQAALTGSSADLSYLGEYVTRLAGYTKSRAIVVDANQFSNFGAGDVHEVAWAIASAVEYVRALIDQDHTADEAFDAINFRVTAGTDQFATIARLRALRTVWNRVGEVFGVSEEHRGARQHAVSSARQLTRDDPYVNVLRGTIQCFGAAIGGAEAITVLPFDTVIGLPTPFSRRVARNTQIVLAEESNIGRVNDPAGGSWYVESLTAQLGEAAWAAFQQVEVAGGMVAALDSGLVADTLADLNAKRAKQLATRAQPITGVSMFPQTTEPVVERTPRPHAPALAGLALVRDSQVFEALRDRASAAKPSVFLACLGSRRDFGAREGFTTPLFNIAGISTPTGDGGVDEVVAAFRASGSSVAVLCSSAKVYAEHGLEAAQALKQAGAGKVFLAGNLKELGADDTSVIDGTVAMGMDVVAFLTSVLDQLGVQAEGVEQ